jgi:hypothetical protein
MSPFSHSSHMSFKSATLRCAIVFPGRKSGFRAGFRPDASRESLNIGPPAGLRILMRPRLESDRNPARKPDFRPGSIIAYHTVR